MSNQEFEVNNYLEYLQQQQAEKERYDLFLMKQQIIREVASLNELKKEVQRYISEAEKGVYENRINLLNEEISTLQKLLKKEREESLNLREKLDQIKHLVGDLLEEDLEEDSDDD
jgi:hypothetical protein